MTGCGTRRARSRTLVASQPRVRFREARSAGRASPRVRRPCTCPAPGDRQPAARAASASAGCGAAEQRACTPPCGRARARARDGRAARLASALAAGPSHARGPGRARTTGVRRRRRRRRAARTAAGARPGNRSSSGRRRPLAPASRSATSVRAPTRTRRRGARPPSPVLLQVEQRRERATSAGAALAAEPRGGSLDGERSIRGAVVPAAPRRAARRPMPAGRSRSARRRSMSGEVRAPPPSAHHARAARRHRCRHS